MHDFHDELGKTCVRSAQNGRTIGFYHVMSHELDLISFFLGAGTLKYELNLTPRDGVIL